MTANWSRDSWRNQTGLQMPEYPDQAALGEVTGKFMDAMLPEIMRRVPDWVEVREGRYPEGNVARAGGGS